MMAQSGDDLNAREKALLRLLAQGHTVKTAAAITADSENAANEVLRSARRKLGVASSREAARLFAQSEQPSQKNRDEFSGIADAPASPKLSGMFLIGGVMLAGITGVLIASFVWGSGPFQSSPQIQSSAASPTPIVVATMPVDGARIAPGPFTLSVTYDRAMAPDSMSFATGPQPAFPACPGAPRQSPDGRTYSIECVAEAGEDYIVWFNYGEYMNFRAAETGMPATPYRVRFGVTAPQ